MARNMGLSIGVGGANVTFKRKFRWLFKITGVSEDGTNALPSIRSSRPTFTFKEATVQHINEEISFPMKAEWKPITLVLYDTAKASHPVIDWISEVYEIGKSGQHKWHISNQFKKEAKLELYDGCGNIVEKWTFENAWPQNIEFGDLDMASSEIVLVTITLRYDRAQWVQGCG